MAKTFRVCTDFSDNEEYDNDEGNEDLEGALADDQQVSDIRSISDSIVQPSAPVVEAKPLGEVKAVIERIECDISPFFYAFLNHHPVHIIVDTGATSSVVSKSFLISVGISPN